MKKLLVLIPAALLVFAAGTAQADGHTDQGRTQLTFGWSGLSDLDIEGISGSSSVGIRRFVQKDLAAMIAVTLGIDNVTDKSQSDDFSDEKSSSTELGLDLALERWNEVTDRIDFYKGVGVGFDIFSEKEEPSIPDNPSDGTVTEIKSSGTAFRANVMAGFQFAVVKGLYLGGSSALGIRVGSGKTEVTREGDGTDTTSELSGFSFGFDTANLYLSVTIM